MSDAASVVVMIPAFDEEQTVAAVIRVALAAAIGPVVVVDDGSRDATARVAKAAGAEVITLARNAGKGGALVAGARARKERFVVLLDADLTGLTAEHVRSLARPVVSDGADMARGVFRGGRWRTQAAQRLLPILNGQRSLAREALIAVDGLADSRYGAEIAIAAHARALRWRVVDVDLPGVSQVMKEEKRGFWLGFRARLRMYREILRQWWRPRPSRDQSNAPNR